MCLMQTDLPVPDGPRIIEIWPSGMPRLRPFSTVLRPNDFLTSMNSTASVSALSLRVRLAVCHLYSSSSWPPGGGSYSTAAARGSSESTASGFPSSPRTHVLEASPPPSAFSFSFSSQGVGTSLGSAADCSSGALEPDGGVAWRFLSSSAFMSLLLPAYGCPRIRAPEDLGPEHPDEV